MSIFFYQKHPYLVGCERKQVRSTVDALYLVRLASYEVSFLCPVLEGSSEMGHANYLGVTYLRRTSHFTVSP